MKISIITVCYNSAKTIEATFKSVEKQDYNDIEYIVVDGGSKDDTLKLAEKYSTTISQLVSEPDKGLYDAMNKGVKLATGDYIGIVNSDDEFATSTVISEIAAFLKTNAVDASIGNITQHRDGKLVRVYSSKRWKPEKLKIGFMPPHPSIFFKKSLFERLGYYDLNFKSGADYELIIRYFLKNRISYAYSGISTTSMAMGGISSSGMSSYHLITKEICNALKMNDIAYSKLKVQLRIFWKVWSLIKK